jgi:hypothetical protein
MKDNVAVLISTYDGANDLWEPLEEAYKCYWNDCDFPIFLTSNHRSFESDLFIPLQIGKEKSWSDNILKSLDKINAKYVLLTFDDLFLNKKVDNSFIMRQCQWALDNNIDYLQFTKSVGAKQEFTREILKKNLSTEYRNATVFSLWNVEVLRSLLVDSENAWEFETKGNNRSQDLPHFYSTKKAGFSYLNGVVKGKWNPVVKNKLVKAGYNISPQRKSFSMLQLIKYEVIKAAYTFKRGCVK